MRRLNILIWHIHGSYLRYLAAVPHNFILPLKPGRPEGYGGRPRSFDCPENLIDVPADRVRDQPLDLVIHQTPKNYFIDQYEILSPEQRRLPRIYLEHNTPKPHPTDSRHPIDDPNVLLVHVTHFNRLMWDSGRTPTTVIEHGVQVDDSVRYTGEIERGIVVVNGLQRRQRIAGLDIFERLRLEAPLDLAGMGSEAFGGLGDLAHDELHRVEARYRFFLNPIRYTSLPLALIEAMAIGMPIVALATTEVPAAIPDGEAGIVSNNYTVLAEGMRMLLADAGLARRIGERARERQRERYGIERFVRDWEEAFRCVSQ